MYDNNYPNNTPQGQEPEQLYPYTPSYHYQQPQGPGQGPAGQNSTPKKKSKAMPMIAAALAISLVSGAAGGGASYLMFSNHNNQAVMAVQPVENLEAPSLQEGQEAPAAADSTLPSASGTTDIAAIVAQTSNSVVEVTTQVTMQSPFGQYNAGGSGSGVIVSEDGYIATNNHVIDGATSITVRTADGTEYDAEFIGSDAQTDLAVVKIDAQGLAPVILADSDQIEVGQLAVAIGNPLGTLGGTVTDGIISAKDREVTIDNQTMSLLQTSAAVNPGNSGGGLFNAQGELVGIVNAKSTSSSSGTSVEGLGFAIPSNTVKEITDKLISDGYVTGRKQLGITIREIPDQQSANMLRLERPGVYVVSVSKENNLMQGDLLVSMNGRGIEASEDIQAVLEDAEVGDFLETVVIRDGKTITVSVPVGEEIPAYVEQRLPESAQV